MQETTEDQRPFVAQDETLWHPIECARVRDAETVTCVESIENKTVCHWCCLFVSEEEITEIKNNLQEE